MIYNRFLISTFIRVVLISMNSFMIVYFGGMEKRLFTVIFLFLILLAQIWQLYRYVSKTNRDLAKFLFYLKYGDTSLHFSTHQIEKIFKGLSKNFNQIIEDVHQIKAEKEEQEMFIKTTVEHIGVGIISFDQDGKVYIFNKAAAKFLGISTLLKLSDLEKIQSGLYQEVKNIKTGIPSILKINLKNYLNQYSFKSTIIKANKQKITLLSIQDIKTELEENELLSYQKLIRVMTHEMMNSLTPITTLTTSIRRNFSDDKQIKAVETLSQENIEDALTCSELIEERSQGLIDFIQKYRTLTKLSIPKFESYQVQKLFDKTISLLSDDIKKCEIQIDSLSEPALLEITMDESLMNQVMINLIKNAMDALFQQNTPKISLKAYLNNQGKAVIEVTDNGIGIDDALLNDIFIPLFTTKEHGSGIGLNFCRQVMRLHNGSISVKSKKGEGSTFTLEF
ncbi:MAG: hypothetical protein KKG99_16065 [Bacteroidetes bacterium]|nr:hypothetical protein [Bacteroidota bacterium]